MALAENFQQGSLSLRERATQNAQRALERVEQRILDTEVISTENAADLGMQFLGTKEGLHKLEKRAQMRNFRRQGRMPISYGVISETVAIQRSLRSGDASPIKYEIFYTGRQLVTEAKGNHEQEELGKRLQKIGQTIPNDAWPAPDPQKGGQ